MDNLGLGLLIMSGMNKFFSGTILPKPILFFEEIPRCFAPAGLRNFSFPVQGMKYHEILVVTK